MNRKKHFYVFARAQVSAFTGGLLDYLIMILCTELLHIYYPVSILISGVIGAVLNFSVNRYWTFNSEIAYKSPAGMQLLKFVAVVAGSILLKSSGTYLLTSWLVIDYKISRIIVDIIISLGFNYTLQTYWVFKKEIT